MQKQKQAKKLLQGKNTEITEKNAEITRKNRTLSLAQEEIYAQSEELKNTLDAVQAERLRSEKLLLNLLPREVAQELKEAGKVTPKYYSQASVLFTDFKGFTEIAAKTAPGEVLEVLNRCFKKFDEIC